MLHINDSLLLKNRDNPFPCAMYCDQAYEHTGTPGFLLPVRVN